MEENKVPAPETKDGEPRASLDYSRREAVLALAKYSAAVGGAAAVVVTADGLVSEASAYGSKGPKGPKGPKGSKGKGRYRARMKKLRRMRRMRRMRRRGD